MKKTIKKILPIVVAFMGTLSLFAQNMESEFITPPTIYRPYVWWHWMGSNFSLSGITKDLEAMKEEGIGGATIFNISSAVQEAQAPTLNNPWPEQTYRSPAYWKAIEFACKESERLGLELGLHNTVGYSTTGGPWIDEAKSMKHLVSRQVEIAGGRKQVIEIARPDLPANRGWGTCHETPTKYEEIAVIAVPADAESTTNKVTNISDKYIADGKIEWKAPKGRWKIFRLGYTSMMATPHPVPDEVIGKTLEADKIDKETTEYHWDQVLLPLKAHVGNYFGKSFKHLLIDSYEAGVQNWSSHFKEDFMKMKGYDPTMFLPLVVAGKKDTLDYDKNMKQRFLWDFKDAIARLYQLNSWEVARKRLNDLHLQLNHEPYSGPFSTVAGAANADIPMGEFWTHKSGMISAQVTGGARAAGHTVIGAEAYTSLPQNSKWTEDPAMLKNTTEGAFASGVNRLYLHQWVHQPFDDRYQPGISMGWWGTHFSRFQTWTKPGKAFFDYLGRCEYLLQQGEQVIDFLALDNPSDMQTDAIATGDFLNKPMSVKNGNIVLYSGRQYRMMQFPNANSMLPAVLDKLEWLASQGATIVARQPVSSPSLTDYPQCDEIVKQKAEKIWRKYAGTSIFPNRNAAMQAIRLAPDYQNIQGKAAIVHRHAAGADIYYIGNLTTEKQEMAVSLRISGKLPELWNAENGERQTLDSWTDDGSRTVVYLTLQPWQSRFVVMRRMATAAEREAGQSPKPELYQSSVMALNDKWSVHFAPKLDTSFDRQLDTLQDFSQSTDEQVKYFSGTATYTKVVKLDAKQLKSSHIILSLGEMNDIAELQINGQHVGVLWYPPYQTDVTRYLQKGTNTIELAVTDNWANRMIGDEQYPADFEWGQDRGVSKGRAIKAYPDWFLKGQPRTESHRKAFCIWYYYRKNSKLQKAGLDGPVNLEFWKNKEK
jgi:hypothetical protein